METDATRESEHDDDVSVTSTINENSDPDEEWQVTRVLAEGEVEGEARYLIEWHGFSLAEATWEPRENLTDPLFAEWEQSKENQKLGKEPRFKIRQWREATIARAKAKIARHRRRNLKRARQGLPETDCQFSFEEIMNYLDSFPRDTDTDEEDYLVDECDVDGAAKSGEEQKRHSGNGGRGKLHETTKDMEPRKIKSSKPSEDSDRKEYANSPGQRKLSMDSSTLKTSPATNETGKLRRHSIDDSALKLKFARPPMASQVQRVQGPTPITARPSLPSTPAPVHLQNVFAGGVSRQKKPNLLDAVSDPTKKPKLFNSHLQRKIEIGRRDREGITEPAKRPTSLISLDQQNQPPATKDLSPPANVVEELVERNLDMVVENVMIENEDLVQSPQLLTGTSGSDSDVPMYHRKRKRVVHWDDDAMEVYEEESLFVQEGKMTAVKKDSPPVSPSAVADGVSKPATGLKSSILKKPSGGFASLPMIRQTVSKICQFGSDISQTITLSFSGVPAGDASQWLSNFLKLDRLVFTHTCTAQDLVSQAGAVRDQRLLDGVISSMSNQGILEGMADKLRVGSFGVLSRNLEYCVLLFPSKCPEWRIAAEMANAMADEIELLEPALKFWLFRPTPGFAASVLPPIQFTGLLKRSEKLGLALYARSWESIFGQKYETLLPSGLFNSSEAHCFFLAFPPRADAEAALVSRWLQASNSRCIIKNSQIAGHWAKFLKSTHGVIIIHEDVSWAVRMFPHQADLLHSSGTNYKFWTFTRSFVPKPVLSYPEDSVATSVSPPGEHIPAVGDIRLHRIFKTGMAVLLTPSFMLSRPEQACTFLRWFRHSYDKSPIDPLRVGKLIFCVNIGSWTYNLALEKRKSRKRFPDSTSSDDLVDRRMLAARFSLWNLIQQYLLEVNDDMPGMVTFAPDFIDGNDEQSLVNWFGHWSIMNMDQIRKFMIVGSTKLDNKHLTRSIRGLKYKTPIVNDPDEGAEGAHGDARDDILSATKPTENRVNRDEEALNMKQKLAGINGKARLIYWCPVTLYYIPVAYWDSDMPFRFGDLASRYSSYGTWFKFFWDDFPKLGGVKKGKRINNTFLGYFYTVDEQWDSSMPSSELSQLRRRPWVAVFRPALPHIRPYRKSQLFIWDAAHGKKIDERKRVYENQLPESQRRLIDYVSAVTKDSLPVETVWIGSFGASTDPMLTPSEVTLQWLETAAERVKDFIPAPESMISQRGWCRVYPGNASDNSRASSPTEKGPSDEGVFMEDECNEAKGIFHPPRGNGSKTFTSCRNFLYHCASKAETTNNGQAFSYTFKPTMEWYSEQRDEGRGFEHIKVASWENLVETCNIDDQSKIWNQPPL